MAGEVGHVVYAARILTYLGDAVKGPSYWIGTLFPDIRHLGVASRHQTHIADVSMLSLVGKNDLQTGLRVHAWVDATREKFLREKNIKEYLPWHPFVPHALKLAEDEALYDHFDDWNLIHRALNTVHDDELYYVNEKEQVQTWHTILQDYFKEKPTDASRKQLSVSIGLSDHSADEINSVVRMLQQNPKTQKLLFGFLEHMETLLR